MTDSAKAIAAVHPKPLPTDLQFKFVDNSGALKTVPLPDLIAGASDELSEGELATAAGGTIPTTPIKIGLTTS